MKSAVDCSTETRDCILSKNVVTLCHNTNSASRFVIHNLRSTGSLTISVHSFVSESELLKPGSGPAVRSREARPLVELTD